MRSREFFQAQHTRASEPALVTLVVVGRGGADLGDYRGGGRAVGVGSIWIHPTVFLQSSGMSDKWVWSVHFALIRVFAIPEALQHPHDLSLLLGRQFRGNALLSCLALLVLEGFLDLGGLGHGRVAGEPGDEAAEEASSASETLGLSEFGLVVGWGAGVRRFVVWRRFGPARHFEGGGIFAVVVGGWVGVVGWEVVVWWERV